MVLGSGAFESSLRFEGGTFVNEISFLQKRPQRSPAPLPYEKSEVMRAMNQEEGLQQKSTVLAS